MKRNLLSILMLIFMSIIVAQADSQQLAFPGADGYGKYTTGGRGGEVCYVTSLEDCSDNNLVEGTLRWAIRHDNGGKPRTILFKVGGTIRLTSKLKFQYDNVSILGQTAPGGGICIAGYDIYLCKANIVIRYVRFRAGEMAASSITSLDMENCKNVILDHCSLTWSMEECLTAYDSDYTTIQWCIIGEGLYNSLNPKGVRSYATQWGGEHSTMHHCLITNCNNRTVRFNGVRKEANLKDSKHDHDAQVISEYANNVIFNWGKPNSPYGGEDNKSVNNDADGNHLGYDRVYMINNYYRPGPTTKKNVGSSRYFAQGDKEGEGGYGEWYLSGNKFEDNEWKGSGTVWSSDNINAVNADNLYGFTTAKGERAFNMNGMSSTNAQTFYDTYILKELPDGGLSGLKYETADEAFESVFKGAGARLPKLDAVDARLLKEAHGDIAPQYIGVAKVTYASSGKDQETTESARGTGIINTPNDISTNEYNNKFVRFDFKYKYPYNNNTAGTTIDGYNIYPDLSPEDGYVVPTDTDGDGMPDKYEDNNHLDKNNAEDGAAPASNGYTNLENFLNAVVAGTVTPDGSTTGVEAIQGSEFAKNNSVEKIFENGRLVIKKGNKVYNPAGQITK